MRVSERGDSPQRPQSTLRGRSGGGEGEKFNTRAQRSEKIELKFRSGEWPFPVLFLLITNYKLRITAHSVGHSLPFLHLTLSLLNLNLFSSSRGRNKNSESESASARKKGVRLSFDLP